MNQLSSPLFMMLSILSMIETLQCLFFLWLTFIIYYPAGSSVLLQMTWFNPFNSLIFLMTGYYFIVCIYHISSYACQRVDPYVVRVFGYCEEYWERHYATEAEIISLGYI